MMSAQPERNSEWWSGTDGLPNGRAANALLGRDGPMRTEFVPALNARDEYGYFTHMLPAGITSTILWPGYRVNVLTAGTLVVPDTVGGWLNFTGGGANTQGIQVQMEGESFLCAANKNIWFEAEIAIADADDCDWMIGLASNDTNIFTADPTELIVFRGDDGDLNIDIQVRNGGTGAQADTGSNTANGTPVRLGFYVRGVTSVTPYVNGTAQTAVTANIPVANMKITMGMLDGATTANNTFGINWIRCLQLV